MAIGGDRPESGARMVVERPRDPRPPWTYAGAAHLPDRSFPLRVVVSGEGAVDVELDADEGGAPPPQDLAEKARLLVRAVYRQAKAEGEAPAWRIVRWRGEK